MTDATAEVPEKPARRSKVPLLIGLVLALAGAAGGFFAVRAGLLPFAESLQREEGGAGVAKDARGGDGGLGDYAVPAAEVAFVPIPPMVISFTAQGRRQHLRFAATMEVAAGDEAEVTALTPRVVDVLNGYLRALELSDLEDPMALTKLRAQMLRRVQIVTGKGKVRDLLVMEFVLN